MQLSKYDSDEKRYINYADVLKNGVGRFNIFFLIFTQILLNPPVSFSRRIRQYFYFITCAFFSKQFRTCANALQNEVTV